MHCLLLTLHNRAVCCILRPMTMTETPKGIADENCGQRLPDRGKDVCGYSNPIGFCKTFKEAN